MMIKADLKNRRDIPTLHSQTAGLKLIAKTIGGIPINKNG